MSADISRVLGEMRALQARISPTATPATEAAPGSDFATLLKGSVDRVAGMQSQARALASAFESGDRSVDLTRVMLAVRRRHEAFAVGTFEPRYDTAWMWGHEQRVGLLIDVLDDPTTAGENHEAVLVDRVRDGKGPQRLAAHGETPFLGRFKHGEEASRLHGLLAFFGQHDQSVLGLLDELDRIGC